MAEHLWRWVDKEELKLYLKNKKEYLILYVDKSFVPKNPIKIDYYNLPKEVK